MARSDHSHHYGVTKIKVARDTAFDNDYLTSAGIRLSYNLEAAAPSNLAAFELLSAARQDTDGLVCAEGIIGWIEVALARGTVPENEIRWLENELDTVGPEYAKRRTAAAIGLLLTGNIDRFAQTKRYDGKLLDVEINPDLTKDDLYLRRLLPRWTELTQALGGETEVLERFDITPERTLGSVMSALQTPTGRSPSSWSTWADRPARP